MTSSPAGKLVLAIYLQTRGFAFVLFEGPVVPVDWGVHEARGSNKNAWCLRRIASLLELHAPDVLVLQDMSAGGTRRVLRIRKLNAQVAELADSCGIPVRTYSREQVVEAFAGRGATTKQGIAETVVTEIPALKLYVPPPRKPWTSEHPRMGLFEAAALAALYFY